MIAQISTVFPVNTYQTGFNSNPDFIAEPAEDTPFIRLCPSEKALMIRGASTKENIHLFYAPIVKKLSQCLKDTDRFTLNFFFLKINSSTAKVLFDIFKLVRDSIQPGKEINLFWGTSTADNDILEIGQDFADIYDLEMKFYSLSEEVR